LEDATVIAFLGGELAPADRSAVERHLGACSACTELITWTAADQAQQGQSGPAQGRPFLGQLAPGSRVDRYQILVAIGRGGMGEV
jgi:anti-sigma factor RsiW